MPRRSCQVVCRCYATRIVTLHTSSLRVAHRFLTCSSLLAIPKPLVSTFFTTPSQNRLSCSPKGLREKRLHKAEVSRVFFLKVSHKFFTGISISKVATLRYQSQTTFKFHYPFTCAGIWVSRPLLSQSSCSRFFP